MKQKLQNSPLTTFQSKTCPWVTILLFKQKEYLSMNPFRNVVRNLVEQFQPVSGKNKHFSWI